MDKRVILAVAGSGKTSTVLQQLSCDRRALVVTYTNNNLQHIKASVIRKFGHCPPNIVIMSYFTLLYSFFLKPFFARALDLRGIDYNTPPRFAIGEDRFLNRHRQMYACRMASWLSQPDTAAEVVKRIEKYFDLLMIDEVQDLGGHDFNLLKTFSTANVEQLLVGDFYQHTFDTSRDGNVNASLYDDYTKYLKRLSASGFSVDTTSLSASHRCSPEVCELVSSKLGIKIDSHRHDHSSVTLVEDPKAVVSLYNDPAVAKLFYQESSKYGCNGLNWGASKGQDHHQDVCVVLNKTTFKAYANGLLYTLPPSTRNRLYVALTRARRHVYLVSEARLKGFKG